MYKNILQIISRLAINTYKKIHTRENSSKSISDIATQCPHRKMFPNSFFVFLLAIHHKERFVFHRPFFFLTISKSIVRSDSYNMYIKFPRNPQKIVMSRKSHVSEETLNRGTCI